jgi:hypothetical protein
VPLLTEPSNAPGFEFFRASLTSSSLNGWMTLFCLFRDDSLARTCGMIVVC